MPTTLVYAIGNPLRADDGVARRVVKSLHDSPAVHVVEQIQLTPEMAPTMSQADAVVFVDADPDAEATLLELMEESHAEASCLSHILNPFTLVMLARHLYGFTGQAWICHVPARDFTLGAPLSTEAEAGARAAVAQIEHLLEDRCTKPH
jgi:hydrogenase maturation protease